MDRDARDFRPVQVLAHGDWHERTARPRLGDHRLDALLGQRDQPAERVQGRAQIVGLLAHDQDPVGLAVARERHAVTVEHAAALRRQQPVIDPVLIRKERVLIGIRLRVVFGVTLFTALAAGWLGTDATPVPYPRPAVLIPSVPPEVAGASLIEEELRPVDLYGNEVSDAIATYSLDSSGALFEEHAPDVELPQLGIPKS